MYVLCVPNMLGKKPHCLVGMEERKLFEIAQSVLCLASPLPRWCAAQRVVQTAVRARAPACVRSFLFIHRGPSHVFVPCGPPSCDAVCAGDSPNALRHRQLVGAGYVRCVRAYVRYACAFVSSVFQCVPVRYCPPSTPLGVTLSCCVAFVGQVASPFLGRAKRSHTPRSAVRLWVHVLVHLSLRPHTRGLTAARNGVPCPRRDAAKHAPCSRRAWA